MMQQLSSKLTTQQVTEHLNLTQVTLFVDSIEMVNEMLQSGVASAWFHCITWKVWLKQSSFKNIKIDNNSFTLQIA